jgi:hypothetical protein
VPSALPSWPPLPGRQLTAIARPGQLSASVDLRDQIKRQPVPLDGRLAAILIALTNDRGSPPRRLASSASPASSDPVVAAGNHDQEARPGTRTVLRTAQPIDDGSHDPSA